MSFPFEHLQSRIKIEKIKNHTHFPKAYIILLKKFSLLQQQTTKSGDFSDGGKRSIWFRNR